MAAQKDMDLFGATVVGFATAVGGGTVRDILIGAQPVAWMQDMTYPLVILAAVPFTWLFRGRISEYSRTLFLFDTIGIALFTISGMEKALNMGLNPFMAGIMGMTSAVVGGIIRDVLCREVPLIFRKEIYATACLLGAVVFYLGITLSIDSNVNYLFTIVSIMGIRLLSIHYELSLPKMKV